MQLARLAILFSCMVRKSAMIPKNLCPFPNPLSRNHRQREIGCEKIMLMGIQPVFYNECIFCGWLVAEQGLMLSPAINLRDVIVLTRNAKRVLFHKYKLPILMTLHFRCHRTFMPTPDVRRQKAKAKWDGAIQVPDMT
jgi:hypothetical protein